MGAPATPAAPPPPVFETAIPSDLLPPLPAYEIPPPPDSEQTFDEGLWASADAGAGEPMAGDAVIDMADQEAGAEGPATATEAPAPEGDGDFATGWAAIRDANIRPYVEWRAGGEGGGGGRRRKKRGRNRDRDNNRRDHHRHRDRERGPRLPGVYNPGGD